MRKSCERFIECVEDYVDGELQKSDLRQWEDHLSTCEQCALELRNCLRRRKLLLTLEEQELPEHFQSSLHQNLLREKAHAYSTSVKRKRYMGTVTFLSGLAASVIIVYGAFILREDFNKIIDDVVIREVRDVQTLEPNVDSTNFDIEIVNENINQNIDNNTSNNKDNNTSKNIDNNTSNNKDNNTSNNIDNNTNKNIEKNLKEPLKENASNVISDSGEVLKRSENRDVLESTLALQEVLSKESPNQGVSINTKEQAGGSNNASQNRQEELNRQNREEELNRQNREEELNRQRRQEGSSTQGTTSTTSEKSLAVMSKKQSIQDTLPNEVEAMQNTEENSNKQKKEAVSSQSSGGESSTVQINNFLDPSVNDSASSVPVKTSRVEQITSDEEVLLKGSLSVDMMESGANVDEMVPISKSFFSKTNIQLQLNGKLFNCLVGDLEIINPKKNLYEMKILVQNLNKEDFKGLMKDLNALLKKDLQKTNFKETKALQYEVTLMGGSYNRFIGMLEAALTDKEIKFPRANKDWEVILTFLQEQ